ncbi:MAG: methyltransferase domain-containing protein [Anaerolineales bacterium]|nr:methyltransferase domain-containing protein [Anaerolineales bacterium]
MSADQAKLAVCHALRSPAVAGFVRAAVHAGYQEFFTDHLPAAHALVEEAFDRLAASQQPAPDPAGLTQVTQALLRDSFHKADGAFWFNAQYQRYKTVLKPETDFQQLPALIAGRRVLDYGCGSGYLAARLARGGYAVYTTDVLDYRYPEARALPFVQMATPTDIGYPDDSVDTALIQAVLHHIAPAELEAVVRRLARVARRLVIKEDTYGVPADLAGLQAQQPLLRTFLALPAEAQFQALVLIDYYANAVAQGLPEMHMPFAFKTVGEWQNWLAAAGLNVVQTRLAGFEPGRLHKSCHVWFVCERPAP